MVLSILTAVLLAPALLGTQESIRQSQAKEKREEHRARRCNLIATCVKSSLRSREIDGRPIVLRNGKLYIDTGTSNGEPFGHHVAGYFLPYPDSKYEGLVTTIDKTPMLNWIYVDKETHEVKYGVRVDAQPNLTGPFNCTRQDRRLNFDSWEGWCAVEEYPSIWALYFDQDDDGLRSKLPMGTRVLEIELMRKEKRWQKDVEERNLDQKAQRAVNNKGETPVEKPGDGPSVLSKTPGVKTDAINRVELKPSSAKEDSGSPKSRVEYPIATETVPESQVEPQPTVELQQSSNTALGPQSASTTDEVLAHYTNDFEGTAGSPTDPHGGSDWSVHGDDLHSSRSLSGYTPASSLYDDETVDEPTLTGHDALKSPQPPLPSIPEAYGPEAGMHAKDTKSQLTSQSGLGRGYYRSPYVEDGAGGGN
ncbi:uncharacterized protein BDZ99DRAFT_412978 [Mytilinidion resinicola]|uniref:Uncharacterized protein n=1 Tax=Mytilinidion resinicola TaxID=574789 RepID=A0A6A6YTU5_9PEZI|nr:uncharacterized protein BDZ99DRAFT_412978 [Mytilinidion resinicola]KAF2812342.1 hypothetical protein BDZ99DRAFT_412978 [Mytilinidion resinicola]